MNVKRFFLEPRGPLHRQYEALRAYFVDQEPSAEVAKRFGYTANSFRVLCSGFRKQPDRQFFADPNERRRVAMKQKESKGDRVRKTVVALRKQNLSIYDISAALGREGHVLSPAGVSLILKEEGFARLPRRRDEERPATVRPQVAAVADVRELDLRSLVFRTQFGGIFLFLPYLSSLPLQGMLDKAGFPGSVMVPAAHAMRSLLALKLFGNARHSHIMSHVLDEGLGLFSGLNVVPKRAFLTEYSCRLPAECHRTFMRSWFDAMSRLGLERGVSFDLDFHTIPFHGEDALVEKHYVSKRSRRQKGILGFLVQDADRRVFCYANCDIRKADQANEILRFVEFWKARTGRLPEELVFDSQFTTHANLNRLNQEGICFITLRRRNRKMLARLRTMSPSAWRRIHIDGLARKFANPRILDETVTLDHYEGPLRQMAVEDLGHEEPTILITNQMRRSPSKLIERYAQRMIIENGIADGIDFFHMDALSSAVPMKVNLDLQLTLMASALYRLLGTAVGNGYETARAQTIFRDFIQATAQVSVTKKDITVRFQKRAHNPLLLAAGFGNNPVKVPWLENRTLHLVFG